jgi:hypothetical protein
MKKIFRKGRKDGGIKERKEEIKRKKKVVRKTSKTEDIREKGKKSITGKRRKGMNSCRKKRKERKKLFRKEGNKGGRK